MTYRYRRVHERGGKGITKNIPTRLQLAKRRIGKIYEVKKVSKCVKGNILANN